MPVMSLQARHTKHKFAIEKILLATDLSEPSDVAFAYAAGIARRFNAALELVNVIDLSATLASMEVMADPGYDVMRGAAEGTLNRLAARSGVTKVSIKVRAGSRPSQLIVEEAAANDVDLIVASTSSKRGLQRLVLGSTAEEILRSARCPTLTAGPLVPLPDARPISFRSIIYATDFSAEAEKASCIALGFANNNAAKLYLCHVATTEEMADPTFTAADSLAALKAIFPGSNEGCRKPECVVENGREPKAILALADRVGADLIVLGARKASFWIEYVKTGLTPALLAGARCPVLTVC